MDILTKIKRLVIAGNVIFTLKAECEMKADDITPELVFESILNAPTIYKVLRSQKELTQRAEKLYVIKGLTYDGFSIYTKGKITLRNKERYLYVFISSKADTSL